MLLEVYVPNGTVATCCDVTAGVIVTNNHVIGEAIVTCTISMVKLLKVNLRVAHTGAFCVSDMKPLS